MDVTAVSRVIGVRAGKGYMSTEQRSRYIKE